MLLLTIVMETEPSLTFLCTQDWKLDIYIVKKRSLRLFQTYFHLRKGNCKLDSDCQRIYINSVVSITNFSKEFFLMRLSASGAL